MNKKALMGAALLASAPTVKAAGTGGGSTEGSKSQRGINHLTLEEAPLENITVCVPGKSMAGLTGDFQYLPDRVAVVINPFETNFVKLTFVVSHMTSMSYERILLLAYSQDLSPSPQIPTPKSINKLGLNLTNAEIVGTYNVSSFGMDAQESTRIGAGNPAPRVKWEFDINLDTTEIPTMMNSGTDTIYMQAALLRKSDFEASKYDGMILSEVDTIQFVPNECPDTMVVEEGKPPVRVTEICADKEGRFGGCSSGTGK
ncbi:MAG: hypothetical protein DRQ49_15655 [Gammaproteobacteria bacterium]|nr:MAG: hypothetical protein DRQ41_13035 [Gammaproteobacteria bacterium]RKZ37756.1 MAG: hypothetical protein DRQ49_15655 [Gammaproteobacteria bacterium]RKZ74346.1 MAG: hypothetical protein DRQ57_11415 [Gammaproteobacteria bacterium]